MLPYRFYTFILFLHLPLLNFSVLISKRAFLESSWTWVRFSSFFLVWKTLSIFSLENLEGEGEEILGIYLFFSQTLFLLGFYIFGDLFTEMGDTASV